MPPRIHQDRGETFGSSRRVFPPPAAKDEPPEGMHSGSKGDVSAIFSEGLSLKHFFLSCGVATLFLDRLYRDIQML